jgi:anti-sigma factor RsiW
MARLNDGMDPMTDRWTDRLSDYLDGDLAPGDRIAVEAHLASCPECRATLVELRRLVTQARSLADRPVERDLWAGIADRIGTPAPRVLELSAHRPRRRLAFTIPQLAAAAVLFLAVGGGAAALALRGTPAAAPAPTLAAPTTGLRAVPAGLPTSAEISYDAAVRDLQATLDAGRSRLSPKTIAVLERNLAAIDEAIAEARTALAADPANAYLSAHLAASLQKKITLLQQASTLANAAS